MSKLFAGWLHETTEPVERQTYCCSYDQACECHQQSRLVSEELMWFQMRSRFSAAVIIL
jgi:hypothetical protein